MVQRSLSLLAIAGLMSCKGDPTGDLRNGTDHLISDPTSLFVGEDSTKLVLITAVDEQGNTVAARFSDATAVGPGITVAKDLTYQPVFDNNGNLVPPKEVVATRYVVTATANTANSSFTVSAGGKDITIPVRIIPGNTVVATSSATAPAPGAAITITVPAPYKFTPASVPTAPGGAMVKTAISADSSQLTALVGPGLAGPVTVSNVRLSYATQATVFSVTTSNTVTTATVPNFGSTFSAAAPALQDTVTMTAAAGFKFLPTSTVTFGTIAAVTVGLSTDSTQLKFVPLPTSPAGSPTVNGVFLAGLPGVPLNIPTTATLTPPAAGLAGTGAVGTAPTIVMPGVGVKRLYVDAGATAASAPCTNAGGAHCRWYKFTMAAAQKVKFTFNWGNTADIGGYITDVAGNDLFGDFACDAHGSGATAQPETCTYNLPAGTSYLALEDFTGAAQNTTFRMALEGVP